MAGFLLRTLSSLLLALGDDTLILVLGGKVRGKAV